MKDWAQKVRKDERPTKPLPKGKRVPPRERLFRWDKLYPMRPLPPEWKTPTVTEVGLHLNFHGVLALLLARLPTYAELVKIAAVVDFYVMVDHVWLTSEAPPLSKELMVLFPFTDVSEHESEMCRELWAFVPAARVWPRDIRLHWFRWLAVRDAHALASADGRDMSWEDAYAAASKKLAGTVAKGSADTMKRSYQKTQRTLKTVGYQK